MKYVVIVEWDTGEVLSVTEFDDERKAQAFLHWIWEDTLNDHVTEEYIVEDSFHEDDWAEIRLATGDCCRFVVEEVGEPPEDFNTIDWERYAPN